MKKYLFFITIIINIVCNNTIISCPHEFSPEDERPFFEQYDIEINMSTQKKENNHEV